MKKKKRAFIINKSELQWNWLKTPFNPSSSLSWSLFSRKLDSLKHNESLQQKVNTSIQMKEKGLK
jgi:hypothetical protein